LSTEPAERLGATATGEGSCHFLVWAPRAKRVDLAVASAQPRLLPMEPDRSGYFRAIVDRIENGALYRYRLDSQKERPDPASRYQPEGVHGPSQVVNDRFGWTDSSWKGLALDQYVIYEVHVGTFSHPGTFEGVLSRIPALKELGITAIELMPVAQFPGARNWGYDGVYPYAVQASYGGPLGLKTLVDTCHRYGMAVALDVVYNHLGPEGNYLADFGPYFTDVYKTPWGDAINYDEAESDHVRRYFIQNAVEWVRDYHIDALRLDAIHAIVDASARTFLEELRATVHQTARGLGREVCLIPESHRNDARLISSPEAGGAGYDAVWNDDFHHSLHVLLTGEQNGYYQDFDPHSVDGLATCYREGFLYSGQYARFWRKRRGNSSKQIPAQRFVVYSQNHDQVGNRRAGDRFGAVLSFEQLKMAAGTVLLSANVPLLFMGEEYGETAPFQYFVSHGDAELIEAVRRGRSQEFREFAWQGEIPDPQSEQTFLRSQLNWDLQSGGKHRLLRRFYQTLLRLRREVPALAHLDKHSLQVTSSGDRKILLVERWHGPSRAITLFHFGDHRAEPTLVIPAGRWEKVLDSLHWQPDGTGKSERAQLDSRGELCFSLAPWSFCVFVLLEPGNV
jgi:maltooligosyltrehalose trehalohydrolase